MNAFQSLYRVFKLDPLYAQKYFIEQYTDINGFKERFNPNFKELKQAEEIITYKYKEGLFMSQFKNSYIKEKSSYNNNYYKGFDNDVLLNEFTESTESDEWYLIQGQHKIFIGYTCYEDENEPLIK